MPNTHTKHRTLTLVVWLGMAAVMLAMAGCAKPPKYRIGVSQNSSDGWRESLNNELRREMLFHPNAELTILSAEDNNEKQAADIRSFIDQGYDLIITSPREADALSGVIAEAMDAGIPVVLFDRRTDNNNYTAFVGADNQRIGYLNGQWIASRVARGKVAEIGGLHGASPTHERHKGFVEALKSNPAIEYVGLGYGDWTPESGALVADSLLNAHPDLQAIFAQNDRMAIAAKEVAKRHGREDLIITGVDATPSIGLRAVADKTIDATQIYPTGGGELVRTAMAILEDKPYTKETVLATATVIDSSGAETMLLQNAQLETETQRLIDLKAEADEYEGIIATNRMLLWCAALVVVLAGLVIFMVLRLYWQRRQAGEMLSEKNRQLNAAVADMEKANAQMEQSNTQLEATVKKLEEATQAKLVFFTNVSHYLRTPLTLIADPVDQMCDATNLTESQKVLMRLARKNCRILMRLINQILDFRKLENHKLELNLSEVDVKTLFREWADSFALVAKKHDIHYEVSIDPNVGMAAMDAEKMERVVFNLLSNAFKYTPDNGRIAITVSEERGELVIRVSDTGRGMSAEDASHIFERFFQVEQVRPKGSGIGLALSKAFIEEHGGTIRVTTAEGKGTLFTVTLPIHHVEQAYVPSSNIDTETVNTELDYVEGVEDAALESEQKADPDKECVLVVDDNADIRALIKTVLSPSYTVIEATGGNAGVRKASKFVPDLVICDVMMPDMDGNECCKRIKENVTTSHVPVLMLTACSLDEQRIEGYESGADGYMSKPFQSRVLLARVASLIHNRRLLLDSKSGAPSEGNEAKGEDERLEQPQAQPQVQRVAGRDIDSEFYNTFVRILEENISNPDLGVEEIADQMGMSRVQVYRKIKALTNYSPVEIMRTTRLKRAAKLLSTTEKTVSEVAYEVGFSTPSYFAKCFKAHFGESPTDLQKRTTRLV